MIKLIEYLNECLNNLVTSTRPAVEYYNHYYELHINDEVLRSVKILRFDSVKELMSFVEERQLMYKNNIRTAMVQVQTSGERHILQLNNIRHADTQSTAGFPNLA